MEHQSRVTQKGQITIPAEFRRELGIKPKDRVRFSRDNGRIVIERVESIAERLAGSVQPLPGPPLTAEEMREHFEIRVAEEVMGELEEERLRWEAEHSTEAPDADTG